ncbi:sensor histidine kinase [Dietzia sp.]|uniref:sensor histidine kinase n=1 Tax=Dietzia sp. TaxID=1871616 RepID=UPI002FD9EC7D
MNVIVSVGLLVVVALVFLGIGVLVGRRVPRRGGLLPGADAREAREFVLSKGEVLYGAMQQAPIALAVVDRFEDLILANDRADELDIVTNHRVLDEVWDTVQESFRTGEEQRFYLAAHSRGGHRLPSVAGRTVFLKGQDQKFVLIFADDDSEQRRMEAARRDFVANVSHELKTPVGAMSVLAEALLESGDDPDSVRYFGTRVRDEAQRLGAMVTELIELSRLQGAEKLRNLEPTSIDEIIDEATRRTAATAEAHDIELTVDDRSGLEVMGDRTLLVTALSNLVSNAINYSPAGTPVVVTRSADDDVVRIRVTDHGIGIAPEHQGRVFERFFRVDKARSRATGGTGLGLAIVKHVVQNHNGVVKLWSRPEMGSTFTIELPRVAAESATETVGERLGAAAAGLGPGKEEK